MMPLKNHKDLLNFTAVLLSVFMFGCGTNTGTSGTSFNAYTGKVASNTTQEESNVDKNSLDFFEPIVQVATFSHDAITLNISIDESVDHFKSFNIKRENLETGEVRDITPTNTSPSMTHNDSNGLSPETSYVYHLIARYKGGDSEAVTSDSVKTKAEPRVDIDNPEPKLSAEAFATGIKLTVIMSPVKHLESYIVTRWKQENNQYMDGKTIQHNLEFSNVASFEDMVEESGTYMYQVIAKFNNGGQDMQATIRDIVFVKREDQMPGDNVAQPVDVYAAPTVRIETKDLGLGKKFDATLKLGYVLNQGQSFIRYEIEPEVNGLTKSIILTSSETFNLQMLFSEKDTLKISVRAVYKKHNGSSEFASAWTQKSVTF